MNPSGPTFGLFDTEKALLGSAFLDPSIVPSLRDVPFFFQSSQLVAEVMQGLYSSDSPIDLITVTEVLRTKGNLDKVGGHGYVTELADFVPASTNWKFYADLIREENLKITAWKVSCAIRDKICEDPDGIAQFMQAELMDWCQKTSRVDVGKDFTFKDSLQEAMMHYGNIVSGTVEAGLPTGLTELDKQILGLRPGDYVVICAETGGGKTALAWQIMLHNAKRKIPVLGFALELTTQNVIDRMIANESREITLMKLRDREELSKIAPQVSLEVGRLAELPIHVRDESEPTDAEIRALARQYKSLHDIQLIVVDYLQLVQTTRKGRDSREQDVAAISKSLKAMAKELNIPVIALSQLNDEGAIRESRQIAFDAKLVLKIVPVENEPEARNIVIAKQTNGPRGCVKVRWEGPHVRFQNLREVRNDN